MEEYIYNNKFPASILGEILRATICEYGAEDYPGGADFVGGGNDATTTTQRKKISVEQTIQIHVLNYL